jgi:hypothetical protein
MKTLLIFTSFFVCTSLHAQESFSASADQVSGAGGSLSYSVGQVVFATYRDKNMGSVAQGVQQTYNITALLGVEIAAIKLELMAYPNPTQDILTIKIDNYKNESLTYQLYDLQGKLWDSQSLQGAQTQSIKHPRKGSSYQNL